MSVAAATHTENISDSVGKKLCSLWVSDSGEHLQEKKALLRSKCLVCKGIPQPESGHEGWGQMESLRPLVQTLRAGFGESCLSPEARRAEGDFLVQNQFSSALHRETIVRASYVTYLRQIKNRKDIVCSGCTQMDAASSRCVFHVLEIWAGHGIT